MPLGMEVGLGPGDCVQRGPSSPQKKGHINPHPIFGPYVYCGQMAEWIKMPLGMEVNLGPGNVVLNGSQLSPKKGTAPRFWLMSIVAKRLYG